MADVTHGPISAEGRDDVGPETPKSRWRGEIGEPRVETLDTSSLEVSNALDQFARRPGDARRVEYRPEAPEACRSISFRLHASVTRVTNACTETRAPSSREHLQFVKPMKICHRKVPPVGIPSHKFQRALTGTTDDHRDPRERGWQLLCPFEDVVATLVGDLLTGPESTHDVECFSESVNARSRGLGPYAERDEFLRYGSPADAKLEPAPRCMV